MTGRDDDWYQKEHEARKAKVAEMEAKMIETRNTILKVAFYVAATIIGIVLIFGLAEVNTASDMMVVQSVMTGDLSWYDTSGPKWQGLGNITRYQKRDQYWFSAKTDQGQKADESVKIRFNDGGHANVSGSISWEMPTDSKNLNALHAKYGSHHAVQQQLIRTVIEKSVYMAGPMMSSKESYSERRNELLRLIEDQVQNGVYLTETKQEKITDAMTGQPKTVNIVQVVMKGGSPVRAEASPLSEFGLKTFNLSINDIKYDEVVERQIQDQQKAMMQVQTAMAKAKEAEQEAITVAKKGEAEAAKAKWDQEVIKAKFVTEAQQKFEVETLNAQRDLKVAELAAKAALETKRQQILLGEGESTRAKLNQQANGNLEMKLEAWVTAQQAWAEAIGSYKGNLVPSIVMGGAAQKGQNSTAELVDLLMAKTAKDISLDIHSK